MMLRERRFSRLKDSEIASEALAFTHRAPSFGA